MEVKITIKKLAQNPFKHTILMILFFLNKCVMVSFFEKKRQKSQGQLLQGSSNALRLWSFTGLLYSHKGYRTSSGSSFPVMGLATATEMNEHPYKILDISYCCHCCS